MGAGLGPELVHPLGKQHIAGFGGLEQPPSAFGDDRGHGFQRRAHRGLAFHRRGIAAGIVPDDIVGDMGQHALDILFVPGGDDLLHHGKLGGHGKGLCSVGGKERAWEPEAGAASSHAGGQNLAFSSRP